MRDVRMKGLRRAGGRRGGGALPRGAARVRCEAEPRELARLRRSRVLAEDVRADVDVPGFARSAMDGYAVRGEDTFGASDVRRPIPLALRRRGAAGAALRGRRRTGPGGADHDRRPRYRAVRTRSSWRRSARSAAAPSSCREAGRTAQERGRRRRGHPVSGDLVLRAGRRLRPQDAGLLASIGVGPKSALRAPPARPARRDRRRAAAGWQPTRAAATSSTATPSCSARPVCAGRRCRAALRDPARPARAHPRGAEPPTPTSCSSPAAARSARRTTRRACSQSSAISTSTACRCAPPARSGWGASASASCSCCRATRSAACARTSSSRDRRCAHSVGRSRQWPHRRVRLPLARKISLGGRAHRLRARRDRARARGADRDLGRVDPVVHGARRWRGRRAARARGHGRRARRSRCCSTTRRRAKRGAAVKQQQFLEVLDRDEAERRWRAVVDAAARGVETVVLAEALGRVLAEDVRAGVDVPGFDRSNMDGFAVRAEDTFGASEEEPLRLRVNGETIPTGVAPRLEVKRRGPRRPIATGGMLPRGADAVLPVEFTDIEEEGQRVVVRRSRTPGAAVSFAGTDMGQRRDRAVRRHAAHLARDRRARGHRALRGAGRAPAAGRDPLDGRRDRAARRGDAARPRVRQQRAHPHGCGSRARGGAALPRRVPRRRGGAARGPRRCARLGGPRAALGRNLEGRGGSQRARRRRARARHRGARRRAQARQADLPGGQREQAGRHPAGLPDLGGLYLPRVRRAAGCASRAGWRRIVAKR